MSWGQVINVWMLAFVFSLLSGPIVIRIYHYLGWLDDPQQRKYDKTVHTQPVPRGGGLVVAVGLAAVLWSLWPWTPALIGIMVGAGLLLITGTLDDHYDLNPYLRYVINILAAVAVIAGGVGIDYVTNPVSSGVLMLDYGTWQGQIWGWSAQISPIADLFALIWIVWNMNAVNWSKGVAGQLPGFVAIAAIFIAMLSVRFAGDTTQGVVTLLALGLSGAYAGLLFWNADPQRMMPGYAGGSLAGYFLAVLSILSGAKIATLLLLIALPTADAIFTVVRRLAAGRSPFWGDRGHLHHRMLDSGWSVSQIAQFYWFSTLIFGMIALQLDSRAKLYAMMAAGIVFIALVLWFTRSITFSKPPDRASG